MKSSFVDIHAGSFVVLLFALMLGAVAWLLDQNQEFAPGDRTAALSAQLGRLDSVQASLKDLATFVTQ